MLARIVQIGTLLVTVRLTLKYLGNERFGLWMTISSVLAMAAFADFGVGIGVLNTMFMSVFERTREIGILRAIGWRPRRVMHMILLESVVLSVGAGIMGTLAGLGIISLFSLVPVLSGAVHAAVSWQIVCKGFVIAVFVGVIGALYPAYRGSCLLPTEALRHE